MSLARSLSFLTLLSLLPVAAGCNKQNSNRGQVTGTVEVDGQRAVNGSITFTPIAGNTAATGGSIVDGRYLVDANIGPSKVAINIPKVVGERKLYDTPDSPKMPITEEALPPQYNDETTLTYDVKPGPNEQNFSLKTK